MAAGNLAGPQKSRPAVAKTAVRRKEPARRAQAALAETSTQGFSGVIVSFGKASVKDACESLQQPKRGAGFLQPKRGAGFLSCPGAGFRDRMDLGRGQRMPAALKG